MTPSTFVLVMIFGRGIRRRTAPLIPSGIFGGCVRRRHSTYVSENWVTTAITRIYIRHWKFQTTASILHIGHDQWGVLRAPGLSVSLEEGVSSPAGCLGRNGDRVSRDEVGA